MLKKAVLLINLGTPDYCDTRSVRKYLKQFLHDPRVIDIPVILRYLLVNLLILPFRSRKSAEAYSQIWQVDGSPLLSNTRLMARRMAEKLSDDYQVEVGMRYGEPSIASALKKFTSTDSLQVIPLFPQYSSAASGSAIEEALKNIAKDWNIPNIHVIQDFYDHPAFIKAYSDIIKKSLDTNPVDVLVFSYHGLPERHITKSECQAACDHLHACPLMADKNRFCYRAQCYATTKAIVEHLQLAPHQYRVAFQSRLGRTPWIKPYTDLLLPELAAAGNKNIAIVCPSFVADCLETLEEINIRARAQWTELGGTGFTFIPCLNGSDEWASGLVELLKL